MRHLKFVMTDDAIDNYGEEWRDIVLLAYAWANKYMPANEFFAKNKPQGYHPGYDDGGITGANKLVLYELKRFDTGEPLSFSLYDWELKRIN